MRVLSPPKNGWQRSEVSGRRERDRVRDRESKSKACPSTTIGDGNGGWQVADKVGRPRSQLTFPTSPRQKEKLFPADRGNSGYPTAAGGETVKTETDRDLGVTNLRLAIPFA